MSEDQTPLTDHASREIRYGRLTAALPTALVCRRQTAALPHVDLLCQWLGGDGRTLDYMLECDRRPRFWTKTSRGSFVAPVVFLYDRKPSRLSPADDLQTDSTYLMNKELDRHRPSYHIPISRDYMV